MTDRTGRLGHGTAGLADEVDVLVVGLGITGAGCALDAASRGLRVLAVDAHDVAFGTSRWSSKLVHGGLRYLARGQVGVAHESAVERGILMETTAPHLTHPLPMLIPLTTTTPRLQEQVNRWGLAAGDLLRRGARTARETLPAPRRLTATETRALVPCLRTDDLRGGLLSWDGQLEDDARLVLAVARTAAQQGAQVRSRVRAVSVGGGRAELLDTLTGETRVVRAGAVVNATGVWAPALAPDVRLRPSRGSHLVLRASTLPGLSTAVTVPVPGSMSRFALLLPQPDGTVYVGLTDEPVEGPPSDVPEPTEAEVGFLLDVVSAAFATPLRREDVVGAFAGLRPLLESTEPVTGAHSTADLSRRHAVLVGRDDHATVVTVVGGKLTTYRRMAEDAVDAAVRAGGLVAGPCRTRTLPLTGAAPRAELAALREHPRLVRRYGTDAALVLATAREVTGLGDDELLAPASPEVPVTLAELVFGVTHEGAADVDDLLDRRTRVGLVTADRQVARPLAERALALAASRRSGRSGDQSGMAT
ncbi:glycerol-3-phosphate dehydrogenase/oxidase [Nocardioides solisilvae]|uniref:glycerol-3-phosphate dehydrogenase/oxidase n=1 Tax=Nocardioides solisilvae TaxID=1542435 RepID=UPI000D74DEC6|nr:glycerol-3-phosphate dehydrogenase/oxidase [Nocardioides solisilvae]